MLKKGFEFAFKVQQFANASDEEATALFEMVFALIEKLHRIHRDANQLQLDQDQEQQEEQEASATPRVRFQPHVERRA